MKPTFGFFSFDIYSKRISFFYNNHEKIGSYFGIFLTFIYISFSLILFIYNLANAFQRKDVKVYDSTKSAQNIPSIDINSLNFYFAFGLEDPVSLNRFVDETIYYPEIFLVDKVKINGKFISNNKKILEYERCKEENFGENYIHLFTKGELNNSYCLKNFNYNLTLSGGFKYEKMSYIGIKIFPCKNTSDNNSNCKPRNIIDYYFSSNYFSILIKNFGFNPFNFSYPIVPILEDMYISVDKGLYGNLIIDYRIAEMITDKSLINEQIETKQYLQFKQATQNFALLDKEDYLDGKESLMVQLRLDDNIFVQRRSYTKIAEIFSRMGGYMQLIHTAFTLLSLLINRFHIGIKIINGIFNFNLQKHKMALKYQSLKDFDSINIPSYNKNLIFSSRKSVKKVPADNKSSSHLIIMNNSISSVFNISNTKKIEDCQSSKLDMKNNKKYSVFPSPDLIYKSPRIRKSKFFKSINFDNNINLNNNNNNNPRFSKINSQNFPNINLLFNNKKESNSNLNEFKDKVSLNLLDYFCIRRNDKKVHFDLYNLGISFYKKRMDLIHVFTLLLITERILLKKHK